MTDRIALAHSAIDSLAEVMYQDHGEAYSHGILRGLLHVALDCMTERDREFVHGVVCKMIADSYK